MQPFKIVVGIDVAQDSLAISIYDGKSHEVLEFDYTQTAIRKNLLNRSHLQIPTQPSAILLALTGQNF